MAKDEKVIATNRKAFHDFFIEETFETGMALQGTEVKSLRLGKANLKDSYARIDKNEVYLYNMHIAPYEQGNIWNHEPRRKRKLLLHKSEIRKLTGKTKEKGYTLVPLKVYFSGSRAKLELALAKGKLLYDKRRAIADKTAKRELERALKERTLGKSKQ